MTGGIKPGTFWVVIR